MMPRLLPIIIVSTLLSVFFLLTAPTFASAAPEVGILLNSDRDPFTRVLAGFKTDLRKRRPGVEFDTRFLGGSAPDAGEGIPRGWWQNRELVLALGSPALERTLRSGRRGPVVISMVLRKKYIRQAADATGVALEFPLETHFAWIRKVLPEARRIGVIYNADENSAVVEQATKIARARGLTLVSRKVSSPRDLPAALDSFTNSVDVLWGISDSIVMTPQTAKALLLFSFRNRIPFIGLSEPWVKAGALYALERNYLDIGKQCAEMADKILGGEPAGAIPPESPRRVAFMINLRTAEQMKIDIPETLRREAKTLY